MASKGGLPSRGPLVAASASETPEALGEGGQGPGVGASPRVRRATSSTRQEEMDPPIGFSPEAC